MASETLAGLSAALPADRHLPLISPLNATTHPHAHAETLQQSEGTHARMNEWQERREEKVREAREERQNISLIIAGFHEGKSWTFP